MENKKKFSIEIIEAGRLTRKESGEVTGGIVGGGTPIGGGGGFTVASWGSTGLTQCNQEKTSYLICNTKYMVLCAMYTFCTLDSAGIPTYQFCHNDAGKIECGAYTQTQKPCLGY